MSKKKDTGKGRMKEVCWNCGDSDHYSRDCPNDKQDKSWTDGAAWKNQKGSKAGEDDEMQGRAIGTAGATVRAKAKTDKGVVSPKNGKAGVDNTSVERQEQHERKLVTLSGGRNRMGSQHSSQSEEAKNSLLHAEPEQSAESMT